MTTFFEEKPLIVQSIGALNESAYYYSRSQLMNKILLDLVDIKLGGRINDKRDIS
ncbi:hypothetical protein N507_1442 [Lacticaseibacillus rhamnosus DSM 14870]|nr:hypothetical protein N507_1442 [Lacticaseibacillus rhamnosus DSM 14870]CAR88581.1 Putative protein without homology [Lacticaseibacillus rhamnosus GG]